MIMVEFSIDRKDRKIDGQRERERKESHSHGETHLNTGGKRLG